MHTVRNNVIPSSAPLHLKHVCAKTLSLGEDMDTRGLHWTLAKNISPEQRLAFALAVYYFGGLYVLIDADRGFLCVARIAQKFARLQKARAHESYRIGHAFAELYDALGFEYDTTVGFGLIEDADLTCPEGFIKGFSDSAAQSLESDVMHVIKGGKRAGREALINNLRHYIDDHSTVNAVAHSIF